MFDGEDALEVGRGAISGKADTLYVQTVWINFNQNSPAQFLALRVSLEQTSEATIKPNDCKVLPSSIGGVCSFKLFLG